MKVLITGAGGFIGSHLVDACRLRGDYIVGLDIKHADQWIRGSYSSHLELYQNCASPFAASQVPQFDVCFHLAAESRIQPSFNNPMLYVTSNVLGTARMLDLCRLNSARMVYAGSSTADDAIEKNVYATTKHNGEDLCKAWRMSFGTSVSIARFYNVYGARQIEDGQYATVIGIFERQYRDGLPLTVTGDGSHRRDFTAVEDIVDGLLRIADKGRPDAEVYPLGSGVAYSILEVARMFVDDSRIRFIPRPPGEAERTLSEYSRTNRDTGWVPTRWLDDYVNKVKSHVIA